MKNYIIIPAITAIIFVGCKAKKKSDEEQPISAVSIIKGQLNDLNKSLYQLTKYETSENTSDTVFLKREDITKYAAPFLALPDITIDQYDKRYEEERLIDAQQESLSIISTAKNEDAEIKKQILIINLDDLASGKVQSIYIDRYITSRDSTIEQKLFWEIDRYFSIASIIEKENQPGRTHFTKVEWQ
jgi:hypothetical protein